MLDDRRERVRQVLFDELRAAAAARIASGASCDAVTAELTERLRRLRTMWRASF
jgi:hypothetical protein